MAAAPTNAVPTISPAEMQILVSRAGLVLNPGQVADLVLAWRQVAGLIASLPHDRPLADDLALSFRLPPPAADPAPSRPARTSAPSKKAAPKKAPGRRAAAKRAAPKTPAKAKPPARAKPRGPAKPKARGRATRGR